MIKDKRQSGVGPLGAGNVLLLAILLALALPVLSYLYFPRDLLWDDAALTLQYVDNLSAGHGYRFNASDPQPIFGASSFLFTVTAASLKLIPCLNHDFAYIRLPGLLGYFFTLFLAYQFLNRRRGPVAGFVGMLTIAAIPQYFGVATSGMETMMAAAIFSAAIFFFYFQQQERLFLICCTGLVFTKLDLAGASLLLVLGHLALNFSRFRNRFPRSVARAALLYGMPGVLFFLFCKIYFGSTIPNSLQAKLIYSYDEVGYPYLHVFFAANSLYRFYALVSLVPFGVLLLVCLIEKRLPSFLFVVVLLASLSLLVQVWLTPFREIFPWYFHVPFLSWQILVLLAINESLELGRARNSLAASYGSLAIFSLMVLLGVASTSVGPSTTFFSQISAVKRWLNVVEKARRETGRFVARIGRPDQLLSTGYGWSAYDSRMRVFDHFGINSREPVEERWGLSGWLNNLSSYEPDFIICHKRSHPALVSRYTLLAIGWSPRLVGHSEWEIYKRKKHRIPYSRITFPDLSSAIQVPTSGSEPPSVRRITNYDYILKPTNTGTSIQLRGLKFDNSIIGLYCYQDRVGGAKADVSAEVSIATLDPRLPPRTVIVRPGGGIVPITLSVVGKSDHGSLRITAKTSSGKGSDPLGRLGVHVRDLLITGGSF